MQARGLKLHSDEHFAVNDRRVEARRLMALSIFTSTFYLLIVIGGAPVTSLEVSTNDI
jgi:hypothetical protein